MIAQHLTRFLFKIAIFFFGPVKRVGEEHIPKGEQFIAACNHMSVADSLMLLTNFPATDWRYFAADKWAEKPVIGWIMTKIGAIFVNRESMDRESLRRATEALEAGYTFGIAPEGTRSKVGHLLQAKDGVSYLALRVKDIKIVPVGIINTDVAIGRMKKLKRTKMEIHFGEPITLPDLGRRVRSRDLEAYSLYIMAHIAVLLPDRYHGYYANNPAVIALQNGEDAWPVCLEVTGVKPG